MTTPINEGGFPATNDEETISIPADGEGTPDDPKRIYIGIPERGLNDVDVRVIAMRAVCESRTWMFAVDRAEYAVSNLIEDAKIIEAYLRGEEQS